MLRQTAPSDRFELIVLSNLPNATEIIESLSANRPDLNWRVVSSHESLKGRFFTDGFRDCRGSVVSILNDDDWWSPEKLEAVSAVFESKPEVGFHKHHCLSFRGEQDPPSPLQDALLDQSGERSVQLFRPPDYQRLARLGPRLREFNDSTISIRSRVLDSQLDALEGTSASEDSVLFYLALRAKATIAIDSRALSAFRQHSGNSSGSRQGDVHQQTHSFLSQIRAHRESLDALRVPRGEMDRVVASMLDEDDSSGAVWEAILTDQRAAAKLSAVALSLRSSAMTGRVPAHLAQGLIAVCSIPAPYSARRLALSILKEPA